MRRVAMVAATLIMSLALAGQAQGAPVAPLLKTTATWTRTTAGQSLFWHASAFAGSTCRLVSFGGTNGYVLPRDTRLFNPVTQNWTSVAATRTSPGWRQLEALTFDPVHNKVFMFGGRGREYRTSRYSATLNDLWSFDPTTKVWTEILTATKRTSTQRPAGRTAHAMVWSHSLSKMVLFGGTADAMATHFNDVWTYGTSWTHLVPTGTSPSPRYLFGFAEDERTGLIVLYGGVGNPPLTAMNDTWLFDPNARTWTQVHPTSQPPAFGEVAMGWSPTVGAVVITGGSDRQGSTVANPGTWAFDMQARNWVRLTTTGGPPAPRKDATLTGDTCNGLAVLTGGANDEQLPPSFSDTTWLLR